MIGWEGAEGDGWLCAGQADIRGPACRSGRKDKESAKQRTCWAAGRVVGAIVEAKVACCTADLLGDIGYRVGREGGACGRGSRLGSVLVSAGCTSVVAAWLHCPHKRCVKAIVSLTPFGAAHRGSGGIGVVVVASGALGAAVVAAHHVCRPSTRAWVISQHKPHLCN